MNSIITCVQPHSCSEAAGAEVGDKLRAVNGLVPKDIIELSYMLADTQIELKIEKADGSIKEYHIDKAVDEELGLEFETAAFDGIRKCHNRCSFCFVDQMMPGLRASLYVRDDDYRLSFLYGNFVTLTNMQEADYERIITTHMSPLYISVHATDSAVRCSMMHNNRAGELLEHLYRLAAAGIEMHTQVVLCPENNDGAVLAGTFRDLWKLYPFVKTMAVVPVGLTKNRAHLAPLRLFTKEEAASIVEQGLAWQKQCRREQGTGFVYLGDEFFVNADKPLPAEEYYDGFPQLENGIGLSRSFIDAWQMDKMGKSVVLYAEPALVPVGESAYKLLAPLFSAYNRAHKTQHILLPVINHFFGTTINVTGLLTAQDILAAMDELKLPFARIILPQSVLNKDNLFLDDVTLEDFRQKAGKKVSVAADARALLKLLSR